MHDLCPSLSSFHYAFGGTGSRGCKQVILVWHFQVPSILIPFLDLHQSRSYVKPSLPSSQALMDPYTSYVYSSDFELARKQRSNQLFEPLQAHLSQQQQQLPPFREVL